MPTILTHAAVPVAMAVGLGRGVIPTRLIVGGVVASMVPDLDVLAFGFGVPYASEFGHRGFTHSVIFAIMLALAGGFAFRLSEATFWRSFLFLFMATVSHGVLDAFTNGGLGVAFLWPWSVERFFAPLQVIEVSPIGLSHFLSQRGLAVLGSEFLWVWLPLASVAAVMVVVRRTIPTSR